MKNTKERLRKGEILIGSFLNLGSSVTAEIVGRAGFDFVVIDLEHGAGSERDVLHQLQAIEGTPAAGIVRVESHERQRAHRVLDLGANGIMFPRVNTADEARRAVAGLTYPPVGVRGVASMNRACSFGSGFRDYVAAAPDILVGVVQIESRESLQNVEDIAGVNGVDVLFVGPLDLSHSLGILGQFDDPRYRNALEATAAAARRHGKAAGILMPKADEFDRFCALGYRFLACGSDASMVNTAACNLVQSMCAARQKQSQKS